MTVPAKTRWRVTASGGDPSLAVDDRYATTWPSAASKDPWIEIDLGAQASLGGLEVYWGRQTPTAYRFEGSADRRVWSGLCRTRHGEGGQDVFGFPPVAARFVRLVCEPFEREQSIEIVEVNLYDPAHAAKVLEPSRFDALGHGPVTVQAGESITVDFGYVRAPLGALVAWGKTYGTVFSVHLSDDAKDFSEVGRITTGDGGADSFWWRSTTARYFRLTVHEVGAPEGAVVDELKLRILNKDRMPIGALERAAAASRGELYPQSLLGRQIYWTALGEFATAEEALFDEYADLEPARGGPQITPLIRLGRKLHGAPASKAVSQSLVDGALPIPSVVWSLGDIEARATALASDGQAVVEYSLLNRSARKRNGALVLAVRPVQVNPYWQHGGHAPISAIAVEGERALVNDRPFAAFSRAPDAATLAEFEGGDVVRLIETRLRNSAPTLRSDSGLLSGAFEFAFALEPGERTQVVVACPMRADLDASRVRSFGRLRAAVVRAWREKLGERRISVGDREISDTLEAQIALILVNSTGSAFKPGPRNYDRTWIRDGSSQALALLWAGLVEEAKAYVLWYAKRVYPNGLVPPILNVDGTVNEGYGSNIEYDAQGEFVGIAAEVYRITKDRAFLEAIFEPVVRASRFIDELCAKTNASHGPETRFHGLVAPSISHEGYSKPSFSYWDDYFALSAWRNCAFLAAEAGDENVAADARAKSEEFAANLACSIRMTATAMGRNVIPGSADRDDVDPHATAIAFEPCRVEDALPPELLPATFDIAADFIKAIAVPDFRGNYTPYIIRDLNAFVALGRYTDAFALLTAVLGGRRPLGWRGWAEVVWSDVRVADYIGDMPHTWIGAEFATSIRLMLIRENGTELQLFRATPDSWWLDKGIRLRDLPTAFGLAKVIAKRRGSRATIELGLTGPSPERVTVRCPGAQRALADGAPCTIDGHIVSAPAFSRMTIEF
jgi:hypothetical protein